MFEIFISALESDTLSVTTRSHFHLDVTDLFGSGTKQPILNGRNSRFLKQDKTADFKTVRLAVNKIIIIT